MVAGKRNDNIAGIFLSAAASLSDTAPERCNLRATPSFQPLCGYCTTAWGLKQFLDKDPVPDMREQKASDAMKELGELGNEPK
jgi:hypothetical protein